jgi:Leucine-rich repeat (LRR) protein
LIPRDLSKAGRLKTLILIENFFIEPILEELGECKSLTKIRIMKNQLNGTIPAGIFNLPLVEQIKVNDNHFFGELSSGFRPTCSEFSRYYTATSRPLVFAIFTQHGKLR